LLAVISAPDIDAQLDQAKANLAQAKANLPLSQANALLARTTLARDEKAGPGLAVTLEQIDQDRATVSTTAAQVEVAKANIDINQAAVERYTVLQAFQQIRAPFSGVITSRNIDLDKGYLITADSSSGSKELFHLMQTETLRVWVNVPQVYATSVKLEQEAVVFDPKTANQQFHGKVKRTADALDPNTRTLLTEVHVANPNNALRPGMYLQVRFVFDRDSTPILIPSAALITRDGGPVAAVLDSDKKVRYRKLQLGRDYGAEIEVTKGLKVGEPVLVHPGDDLPEGTVVEPMAMPK
jgi:RND family efflux transporter MFP subunit